MKKKKPNRLQLRRKSQPNKKKPAFRPEPPGPMRLNKYVAHCGIASRRQAAELVKAGKVTVNGEVKREPYYVVQEGDEIAYEGRVIRPEEKQVYILLNKPKNTISTVSDEKGRRTVLDLLRGKVDERIFPVGRLDRNTTGLLLLTNDGELAQRLAHPSHEVSKVYLVALDKPLRPEHLQQIRNGLELDDGPAPVDEIVLLPDKQGKEVSLEIHIGRNRIVRRLFEHLGYEINRLDRTHYAGLTKKDLPRGFHRHLTEEEVRRLKYFKE